MLKTTGDEVPGIYKQLKPTGNEVPGIYKQLMSETAPSKHCVVCYVKFAEDFGHNRGVTCEGECSEWVAIAIKLMNEVNVNIAANFHKLNLMIAKKRWKGVQ